MMSRVLGVMEVGAFFVLACGAPSSERGSAPDAAPVVVESEGVNPPSAVAVRWVSPQPPSDRGLLRAPAVVRAPGARADVTALVRVQVSRIHVSPGDRVSTGDPIVTVTAPEVIAAAAEYAGSASSATLHEGRARELEALGEEGLAPRDEVFAARARADESSRRRTRARADLRALGLAPGIAARALRTGRLELRSPVSGVVTTLSARVGGIWEPGSPALATIVGTARPRVEVRTTTPWPPVEAIRFAPQTGAPLALVPEPIARVLDPEDGGTVAWYALQSDVGLEDGIRGTAYVDAVAGLWELPAAAVGHDEEGTFVVRHQAGNPSRVPVQVRASSGASALVEGPLAADDRVAADASAVGGEVAP